MIARALAPILRQRLTEAPAVALTGPRQVGKTTLALEVAASTDAIYLDLESVADRARLSEPELFLADHLGRLVILDEVQRAPGLFSVLRGMIDRARREEHRAGHICCSARRRWTCCGSRARRLPAGSATSSSPPSRSWRQPAPHRPMSCGCAAVFLTAAWPGARL